MRHTILNNQPIYDMIEWLDETQEGANASDTIHQNLNRYANKTALLSTVALVIPPQLAWGEYEANKRGDFITKVTTVKTPYGTLHVTYMNDSRIDQVKAFNDIITTHTFIY